MKTFLCRMVSKFLDREVCIEKILCRQQMHIDEIKLKRLYKITYRQDVLV